MAEIIVSALNIYPVKSCRGISKSRAQVELFGLQGDRRWMLVDDHGVFITQRQQPRMCLIDTEETPNGIRLQLPDGSRYELIVPSHQQAVGVTVWQDQVKAVDAGDEAAEFLSEFLQLKCRLVYFPDEEVRQVDLTYARSGDKTAFSDGFPILLISEASLEDLNSRLAVPLPMSRFRPNLVVKGCDAYAEDSWKEIRIADVVMRVVKPCSRCTIPTIDIATAEKSVEPLATLATYRKKENKVYFGQNVIADNEGVISTGDTVEIIAR